MSLVCTDAPRELFHEPHWFACRTRSRSEKRAHALLEREGRESYLPLVEEERAWSDRTRRVERPLFPGYVFVRFSLDRLAEVLALPHLVTVARPNGYPTPVRDEALDAVRRMVEGVRSTGILPTPADYLSVGDEVVVREGPFRGLCGVLVEERGRSRIVVRIPALRQASGIDVPREMCRPAA